MDKNNIPDEFDKNNLEEVKKKLDSDEVGIGFVLGLILGLALALGLSVVGHNKSKVEFVDDTSVEKPVVYLYPTEPTMVDVSIDTKLKNSNIQEYPAFTGDNIWSMQALPDGTLYDHRGRAYPYLFWDMNIDMKNFNLKKDGFIVAREDIISFLEDKLSYIGLNDREQADFITYWYSRLMSHPYTFISFQTERYEELVNLSITPIPDSLLRLYVVFEGLDSNDYQVKPQELQHVERKGFIVVEWGGTYLG